MNQDDFLAKIIGTKWVNRASSFEACDCWGLVMLYYKEVLSIELPTVDGFEEGESFDLLYYANCKNWQEVDKPNVNGLVFTAYKGNRAAHVGVVISPTHVLHSRGSVGAEGQVEIHSIRAIERLYGKVTFHKFVG